MVPLILLQALSLNEKPDCHSDWGHGNPVPVALSLGNPAIRLGPVAFRPTITRGLALSASLLRHLNS
jgi:hypothetical protein